MPIPKLLPDVDPVIPRGYLFIALTMRDPALPVAIMHWPTVRRDGPGEAEYMVEPTPERVEARIREEGHDVLSWRIIPYSAIPKDRTYRNAWADVGTLPLAHDLTKAKAIHRDHIRAFRARKLVELDIAYQRADETGDMARKATIARSKQRLRDAPADPAIAAARTLDDIRAIWPDELA